MPVIFKIIWLVTLFNVLTSVMGVFSAPDNGFLIMGRNIYGLWAANLMFIINILVPVILLVGMYRRKRWTVAWGVLLCIYMIVNESLAFRNIPEMTAQILEELSSGFFDTVPGKEKLIHSTVIASLIFGIAVDIFFLVSFIVKRNYFFQKPVDDTQDQN